MKRWLMGLMAALCFVASAWVLWLAELSFWAGYGSPAHELAALKFMTGLDRSGGVLDMNASDYLEARADAMTGSAFALALAVMLARLGWLALRRLRRGVGDAAPASPMILRLVGKAAVVLALLGCLTGWMSLEYCSSWYASDPAFLSRDDLVFVMELRALSLLGLLGAAWLLPRGSRLLTPVLVLALVAGWLALDVGGSGECLSLPGILHGGSWFMRVEP